MALFSSSKKKSGKRKFLVRQSSTVAKFQKRSSEDRFFQELVPGTVFSRVYFDRGATIFTYEVIEPELRDRVKALYSKYKDEFFKAITNPDEGQADSTTKKDAIPQFKRALRMTNSFTNDELDNLSYYVERDILGFGKIDPLMKDSNVEDISCDAPGIPVYVFHRSFGFIPTSIIFNDATELETFIKKILQEVGRHISIANPIVDATLEDGSRISASLGRYITNKGSSFTIRKFREEPLTPLDLTQRSLCNSKLFAYLWVMTEYGGNIMVVGGTATGKTTLLNALLLFVPGQKKLVSIEDTREINLIHENWVPMVTRTGYGKMDMETGKRSGEIDMFDLLTVTMRQRPNYVIVGEVRGAEAFTLFQAMSIGRYVYGTFHADDISTFIHRMESKPINIPRNLILALDVVIILQNDVDEKGSRRRVKSVSEITGQDEMSNDMVINNAFLLNEMSDTQVYSGFSYAMRKIADKEGTYESEIEKEIVLRSEVLDRMIEKGITNFKDFFYMINQFYKNRTKVFQSLDMTEYIQP